MLLERIPIHDYANVLFGDGEQEKCCKSKHFKSKSEVSLNPSNFFDAHRYHIDIKKMMKYMNIRLKNS